MEDGELDEQNCQGHGGLADGPDVDVGSINDAAKAADSAAEAAKGSSKKRKRAPRRTAKVPPISNLF